jgi:hypothetical protein
MKKHNRKFGRFAESYTGVLQEFAVFMRWAFAEFLGPELQGQLWGILTIFLFCVAAIIGIIALIGLVARAALGV